jgi:hypothetical protein
MSVVDVMLVYVIILPAFFIPCSWQKFMEGQALAIVCNPRSVTLFSANS